MNENNLKKILDLETNLKNITDSFGAVIKRIYYLFEMSDVKNNTYTKVEDRRRWS